MTENKFIPSLCPWVFFSSFFSKIKDVYVSSLMFYSECVCVWGGEQGYHNSKHWFTSSWDFIWVVLCHHFQILLAKNAFNIPLKPILSCQTLLDFRSQEISKWSLEFYKYMNRNIGPLTGPYLTSLKNFQTLMIWVDRFRDVLYLKFLLFLESSMSM